MSEKIALWGGRFQGAPAEALAALSVSTHFDWRLADYDLQGSLAHAKALHEAKLLTDNEYLALTAALEHLRQDVASGAFTYSPEDEDVHTALERGLLEDKYAGAELGGKLRAGRSRNDQIATLIRMYLRDAASHLSKQLMNLAHALINQAEAAENHLMPGRTHMQHAQPVLVAHQLMAHCWPQIRNLERLADWRKRNDASPYGGGALAGNTLGLDPELVARELGFANVCQNSIDGTASRDGVAEFLYILTQIAVDMSRLAEEIVIWNTAEFDYVTLDDAYSTGSSIMPQKKNPDVAELARGKAGRLIGDLTGLLAMLKGLPLAYDRDLQEDKEPVFDAIDTLEVLLPAMTGMVETMRLHYDRMEALSTAGFSLATDVAEWLVKQGMPFRRAHEVSGACVALAESRGCGLEDLSDADFAGVNPALTSEVRDVLSASSAVSARRGAGGTAPVRVAEQISAARVRLEWLGA
ncbi:argininosuccinate lyase [Mobiluncus mulieris]|uniref:Argininosuccinate lyase n=1 Tax=Mobiluncus mulieris TaxID=2052 RepID=A0A8G2HRS9_9ACTO|nr:argininosuccinate lyase [Mobiluncus mulieris]MBB5845821.1 argininosuccinate lyase [Mobiluncus mulieris]STO15519.1 Argininosuccinate lyase [Mobiluncus mulieris]